jgi:hypothetical protein
MRNPLGLLVSMGGTFLEAYQSVGNNLITGTSQFDTARLYKDLAT